MKCRICGGEMVEVPYRAINAEAQLFACVNPGCSFCRVPRLSWSEIGPSTARESNESKRSSE